MTAIVFSLLAGPEQLPTVIPVLLLMFVGGTTFIYVGVMIQLEREHGTLAANMTSPMRASEFLWGKILTLTGLATLEAILLVGLSMGIMSFSHKLDLPNIPILLLGIIAINILFTLSGIIVVLPYDKFTDFLIPMAFVVGVLQLPFLYFWGVVEHWLFLIFPTSAPTMIIRSAFIELETWEWVYGIGYTAVWIAGLGYWAWRGFQKYTMNKIR